MVNTIGNWPYLNKLTTVPQMTTLKILIAILLILSICLEVRDVLYYLLETEKTTTTDLKVDGGQHPRRVLTWWQLCPLARRCSRVRPVLHGPHHRHHPAVHGVPGALLPDGVQAQLHLPERVLQRKLLHRGRHLLRLGPHRHQQRQVGVAAKPGPARGSQAP